ncbi:hypothetical protein L7F22_059845 [Adiantum nelumboides]|nr:hypothetical protein [Adiantum nelumboides]
MSVIVFQIKDDPVPVIQLDYKNKKQWEPLSGVILDGAAGVKHWRTHEGENGHHKYKTSAIREQIYNVLVRKKQSKPIHLQSVKPDMNADDWIELDELARSTIMLTLHKSVYFNVKDTSGAYGVWSALSNLYEKKSAVSQVYWLKKLIDLRMKESTPMSNYLNEFHTIVSQLQSQGVEFDDSVRAMFLLVTLSDLWDSFRTSVSNFAAPDGLKCADVESSLLMEEVNRKNVEDIRSSNAMHVRGRSCSRGNFERRDKSKNRSRSKSRPGKGVECYYCHKKSHMKKDCYKFKWDKKKNSDNKRKGKNASDDRETNTLTSDKGKCIVDSEELKALTHDSDGDIWYASNLCPTLLVATNSSYEQDWIVDSGASFLVTPHKEWFSSYESRHGMVRLGNNYACDIIGARDIKLSLPNGSIFTLTNVRHVPKLTKSLISTGQLHDAGYHTTFGNQSWKICKGSLVVMRGNKCGTLYPLHVSRVHNHVVAITEEFSVSLWHRRLGHMSQTGMEYLSRFKYIPIFDYSDFSICEYCMFGKQNKSSHLRRGSHKYEHLELVLKRSGASNEKSSL